MSHPIRKDAGGEVHPIEIENLLSQWNDGQLSPSNLHKQMPSGWKAQLNKTMGGETPVWSPSGQQHFIKFKRGGTVKHDPVRETIRKAFGGPSMGLNERSLIPKPPRLNQLGRMGTSMPHMGMIHSVVPGRTDKLPMNVKGGSYVVPADIVSGVGQGNSMAGANAFNKLFKMGPYGVNTNKITMPNTPGLNGIKGGMMNMQRGLKEGGTEGDESQDVPIVAAGGEFAIPPDRLREVIHPDLKKAHDTMDKMVLHLRKKLVHDTRKLKPPKTD